MSRPLSLWDRWNGWISSSWSSTTTSLLLFLGPIIVPPPFHIQDNLKTKATRIEACLAQSPVDLWELRELALSQGGLLSPAFRQRAWPLLVGFSSKDEVPPLLPDGEEHYSRGSSNMSSSRSVASTTTSSGRPPLHSTAALADSTNKIIHPSPVGVLEHKKSDGYDASIDLIRRDVNRSVVFRYNHNNDNDNHSITSLKGEGNDKATPTYASERLAQALENTIKTSTFRAPHPTNDGIKVPSMSQPQQHQDSYHYYQGLHDVAGVVLHQLDYDVDMGTAILQRLAQSHWRDALRENFGNLTWIINHLFLPLVEKVDPNVHYQLQVTQVEMSNLILPWMITWFTHDIFQADTAGRLVDAFVSSHPMLPLYFSVALLTHPRFKATILEADPNDPASLFVTMKQLPKYIASILPSSNDASGRYVLGQDLLDDALELLRQYPPRSLLDLVDKEVMVRTLVIQRANSISMFQAVRSWTISSSTPMSPLLGPLNNAHHHHHHRQVSYTRAKLASGVPLLIDSVGPDWIMHRHRIRQRRTSHTSSRKSGSRLQKLKRLLVG